MMISCDSDFSFIFYLFLFFKWLCYKIYLSIVGVIMRFGRFLELIILKKRCNEVY